MQRVAGLSAILCSEIFVYSEGKILEKGHFMDLQTNISLRMFGNEFVVKKRFFEDP